MKTDYVRLTEHSKGELAYIDTFAGLVKCKVTEVQGKQIHVEVTATLGGYKKGEQLVRNERHVIPRMKIRRKNHGYRISNQYRWIA